MKGSEAQGTNEEKQLHHEVQTEIRSTLHNMIVCVQVRRCVSRCVCACIGLCRCVGHCGSLVDMASFVRRVAGSNPALAAT